MVEVSLARTHGGGARGDGSEREAIHECNDYMVGSE